jgi:Aldo/keto reductase family
MRYRLLGNSGLRVSEAALGTMTFGDDWGWGAVTDEARKVYDAFREAGGNFIDTANVYTNGTSESFLGEFMEGHRQSVVMATKYTNAAPGTDPNAAGNHRKSMVQAVEASLKRDLDLTIQIPGLLGGGALGHTRVPQGECADTRGSQTVTSKRNQSSETLGEYATVNLAIPELILGVGLIREGV